jgi:sulfate transporter 4
LTFVSQSLPTLAAIVISGVVSLVDSDEAIYLWKVHKFDFGVWMFAFLGTLFLGVELGLGIAVGLSLFLVIFESAYPHTAILGRLPGTTEYRNIKNYGQAERYDGIVVVRVDAPIYFANTQNFRDKVQKYVNKAKQSLEDRGSHTAVKFVIVELSAVAHVDTSALHSIQDMHKNYTNQKIQLCFTNPNVNVMARLVSSGIADEVGRDHIFVSTHDAVSYCLTAMDSVEISMHPSSKDLLITEKSPILLLTVSKDDVAMNRAGSDLSDNQDIEGGGYE